MNKQLKYYRSIKGVITHTYLEQVKRTRRRNYPSIEYTKEEFVEWMTNHKDFITLYSNWVESGFDKMLSVSTDRKDDYKGYSFDNMVLGTWQQNYDKFNGDRYKSKKPITGVHTKTGEIVNFASLTEASEKTGLHVSNIGRAANKERKTSGGYVWNY